MQSMTVAGGDKVQYSWDEADAGVAASLDPTDTESSHLPGSPSAMLLKMLSMKDDINTGDDTS